MTINAKLILDGSNSNIQDLEMGIFSLDDECRGSDLPKLNSQNNAYIYHFPVYGTEYEKLIIKFYDHATAQEIVYFNCNPATIEFIKNGTIKDDFCLNTKFTVSFVPTGNLNITNGQANVYVNNSTTPAAMKASTEMLNGKFDYGQTFTFKVADGYKIKNAEADNHSGSISDDRTEFSFELYNEDVSVSYELSERGYDLTTGTSEHGTLKFSVDGNEVTEAYEGDEVIVTVNAATGWQASGVTAEVSTTWENATARRQTGSTSSIPFASITPTKVDGTTNQWSFTMPPAAVKVSATYSQLVLTVTADNTSVTYGAAKPSFTVSYSGFLDGDDATCLGGTLSFDCDYTRGASAGSTFTITPKGLTSDKYDITFVSGTLTVNPASMSVSAKGWSGEYDGQGHSITVTVTKPSGATVKYRAGTSGTYSKTNPSFTDVGTYTVYYKVTKANYTTKSGNKKVIITPADVKYDGGTITMDEKGYHVSFSETPETKGGPEDSSSADPLPISGHVDDLDYSRKLGAPKADDGGEGQGEVKGDVTIGGKEANLFTVCLPFALPTGKDKSDDVTYYTLSSISGTTLDFTAVEDKDIAAFTPYLIAVTGDSGFTLSCTDESFDTDEKILATTVQTEAGDFTFTGTLTGLSNGDAIKAAGEGNVTYILQKGSKWGKVKNDTEEHRKAYVPPFRAFVTGPDVVVAEARTLVSSFGETVGIDRIRTTDSDGTERWYDLNGRRIEKPHRKGLYIRNGKVTTTNFTN